MEFYDYDSDLTYTSHFNMQIINSILDILPYVFPVFLKVSLVCLFGYMVQHFVRALGGDYVMSLIWSAQHGYLEFITMLTMVMSTMCILYLVYRITAESEIYFSKIKKERAESLAKIAELEEKVASMKFAFKQIVIFAEKEELKLLT